jgi:hypothetical protein
MKMAVSQPLARPMKPPKHLPLRLRSPSCSSTTRSPSSWRFGTASKMVVLSSSNPSRLGEPSPRRSRNARMGCAITGGASAKPRRPISSNIRRVPSRRWHEHGWMSLHYEVGESNPNESRQLGRRRGALGHEHRVLIKEAVGASAQA